MRKPNLPGVFQILFDCPPHFGSEEQVEDRISSIVQKHEDYTLIGMPPKVNLSCASSVDDSLPLPVETEYGVPKAPTDDVFTEGHSGSKSQKPKQERTSQEEEKVEETNFVAIASKNDRQYRSYGQVKPYVCKHCKRRFCYHPSWVRHMKLHTIKLYTCCSCNEIFQKVTKVKRGLGNKNKEIEPTKCDECLKQCDECGSTFSDIYGLKKHVSYAHDGKPAFKCKVCGIAFRKQNLVKRHMTKDHIE